MHIRSLNAALRSSWALLLGFGILMLGDGLQGTLLAVRADQEGFSPGTTGLIMSSFYAGFLAGSVFTPRIVKSVGHIRAFAALASLASTSILVHAIFLTIPVWIGLRLVSGFCLAGLYVVAESWLNDRATNENRGQLLSLYMIVSFLGVAISQLFLNLADTQGYSLFILASILISIAVIPLLLSARSTPAFRDSVNIRIMELVRTSPLGTTGMFIVGLVSATFFSLGPVYARRLGLDLEYISYFMACAVIGTIMLQWPIGWISDQFDRRKVINIVAFCAAVAAVGCYFLSSISITALLLLVALFGGLSLPLYSLCIAYTNDRLDPSRMVAASGTLVLINGLGSILGPTLVAIVMEYFGIEYFFICLAVSLLILNLYSLVRKQPLLQDRPDGSTTVVPTSYHPSSYAYESAQQYACDEYDFGNQAGNDTGEQN